MSPLITGESCRREVVAHAFAIVVVEPRSDLERVPHEIKLDVSRIHLAPGSRDGEDPPFLTQALLPLAVLLDAQQDIAPLHALALPLTSIGAGRVLAAPAWSCCYCCLGLVVATLSGRPAAAREGLRVERVEHLLHYRWVQETLCRPGSQNIARALQVDVAL